MQAPAEKVPPLHRMDPFGITLAVPQVRDLWVVISGDYPGLEHRRAQVWSPIICAQRMTEVQVFCSLMGQGGEALPVIDALGCLRSLRARWRLMG